MIKYEVLIKENDEYICYSTYDTIAEARAIKDFILQHIDNEVLIAPAIY